MIVNITDLAKSALDEMFENYNQDSQVILDKKIYIRIYLKEIA